MCDTWADISHKDTLKFTFEGVRIRPEQTPADVCINYAYGFSAGLITDGL